MAKARSKKGCSICGGDVDGKGDVCPKCAGLEPATGAGRRVAERVRDRLSGSETGGFVCPYCRQELSWESLRTTETEVTIYVREKIYFCPECRAFLGVSSWHTEG